MPTLDSANKSNAALNNGRKAIFFPFFSKRVLQTGLIVSAAIVAMTGLGLPSTTDQSSDFLKGVFGFALTIPAIRANSSLSAFPCAYALSIALALLLAALMGVFYGFSEAKIAPFQSLVESQSSIRRIAGFCFAVLVVVSPFRWEMSGTDGQLTSTFFNLVRNERIAFVLWSEVLFFVMLSFWVWCLFESSNFISRRNHDYRNN